MKQRKATQGWVLVLLADGFDEEYVVSLVHELRSQGVPVRLVGQRSGARRGMCGIRLLPDVTLETLGDEPVSIIVFPAGLAGAAKLWADPRVCRLVNNMLSSGRPVALAFESYLACQATVRTTCISSPSLLTSPALLVRPAGEGGNDLAEAVKQRLLLAKAA